MNSASVNPLLVLVRQVYCRLVSGIVSMSNLVCHEVLVYGVDTRVKPPGNLGMKYYSFQSFREY